MAFTSPTGLWFARAHARCSRDPLTSAVAFNSQNYVEIGWAEDPTGFTPPCAASSQPRVFAYRVVNGTPSCWVGAAPANGQYDTFRVDDADQNTVWSYYWEGNFLLAYDTTFTNGGPAAQGERRTLSDPMYSNFDGLDRMGASGNWNPWDAISIDDRDEEYRGCARSNTHLTVQINPC